MFIGRRAYSIDGVAIYFGVNTKGYINCKQIISDELKAMELDNFTDQITIVANEIIGNEGGENGSVYSFAGNFLIRNAKITNLHTDTHSRGISLIGFSGNQPTLALQNVKIITQETSGTPPYNEIILYNQTLINVKNYGLFANRNNLSDGHVNLVIGDLANYQFIPNSALE
ncbi:MAG: hypothetical protein SGI89_09585 [bacterium]|nr:hypothetical protein [bacterium]